MTKAGKSVDMELAHDATVVNLVASNLTRNESAFSVVLLSTSGVNGAVDCGLTRNTKAWLQGSIQAE